MLSYKIHLIRHGMTRGNLNGQYIGRTDTPMCEEGFAQLEQLKDQYDYPQAELVYVSPLTRCRQTAEVLYPDHLTQVLEELIECDLGSFEGKTIDELRTDPDFLAWVQDSVNSAPPGGESGMEFARRCVSALQSILSDMMDQQAHSAAVVTHGGVIMAMLAAVGLPRKQMTEWAVGNGMGYTILMTPQMWMRDQKVEVYDYVPRGVMNSNEQTLRSYGVYEVAKQEAEDESE